MFGKVSPTLLCPNRAIWYLEITWIPQHFQIKKTPQNTFPEHLWIISSFGIRETTLAHQLSRNSPQLRRQRDNLKSHTRFSKENLATNTSWSCFSRCCNSIARLKFSRVMPRKWKFRQIMNVEAFGCLGKCFRLLLCPNRSVQYFRVSRSLQHLLN